MTDYSNLGSTTYDRPVKATLHVHLDNGEVFDATVKDLDQFGFVSKLGAYVRFEDTLRKGLMKYNALDTGSDLTDAKLNPLRYLVELALCHPSLLESEETQEVIARIADIERALQRSLEANSI